MHRVASIVAIAQLLLYWEITDPLARNGQGCRDAPNRRMELREERNQELVDRALGHRPIGGAPVPFTPNPRRPEPISRAQ
ncbi:MAG: hypothetical protein RJA70_1837 [Pseudomonadota bacterium]|jgi:hypothetical protein